MSGDVHSMMPRTRMTVGRDCARRGLWRYEFTTTPKWEHPDSDPVRDFREFTLEHHRLVGFPVDHVLMAGDVAEAMAMHVLVGDRVRFGGPAGARVWELAPMLGHILGVALEIDTAVELPGRVPANNLSEPVRLQWSMRGCLVAWSSDKINGDPGVHLFADPAAGFLADRLTEGECSTDRRPVSEQPAFEGRQ